MPDPFADATISEAEPEGRTRSPAVVEAGVSRPTLEPTGTQAESEVARFLALSADVRGCAVLESGRVLASSGDPLRWGNAANGLVEAADRAAGGISVNAHIATEDGEVFAVRDGDRAMVAVTDRFTLASLVLADMRACLRALGQRADGSLAAGER